MNNIIEKLGIGILNYGRIEPDNLDGDLCMVSEEDLNNFTEEYKEMLEALINEAIYFEDKYQSVRASFLIDIIEKVANIKWDIIKELYNA